MSNSDFFEFNVPITDIAVQIMADGLQGWGSWLPSDSEWNIEGAGGDLKIVAGQDFQEGHIIHGLTAVRAHLLPEEIQLVEEWDAKILFGPASLCHHQAYAPNCQLTLADDDDTETLVVQVI